MLTRCLPLWVCTVALAMGCGRTSPTESANFGRFEGEVVAVWDSDGRHMTLREDFAYVDPQNRRWTAPAGTVVDGASIPRAFWTVIGGPFEGRFRNASVVHDIGCIEMQATWEDVHRMFYEACRCGGVDEQKAKMLYYAVYHFGPRWRPVVETRLESRKNDAGQLVEEPVTVTSIVRDDPPPPTEEELQQVVEFIAEENPTPDVIRRFDRDTLRKRPRSNRGQRGEVAGASTPGRPQDEHKAAAGGQRKPHAERADGPGGERSQQVAEQKGNSARK